MDNNKFDIVIPAAGIGSRMKSEIPKQYLKVNNKTILEHTINAVRKSSNIGRIIVVIKKDDSFFYELNLQNVDIVIGGDERSNSVYNGLLEASSSFVLVHDAARPLILAKDIDNLINSCFSSNCVGGILVSKIADTIKKSNDGIFIDSTLPRDGLYRALTPQFFKKDELIKAYQYAFENNILITDEASAIELLGHKIKIVEGSISNIKVTEPSDLEFISNFL